MPIFVIRDDKQEMPLYAAAYYEVPLKRVMTVFKDKANVSSLMVLYHLMRYVRRPQGVSADNAVLVPTPTTGTRLVERGFHPVLILTKYLSFLWQIPIWQGISRLDNAIHQRGLSRSDRLYNVKHDFYLTDPLPTRHAILVDDVVTTGSTLLAMANAIWAEHSTTKIHGVCALHGRDGIHLPVWGR
ncbi:ComF family protein [Moraxella lacunata]|nr:ComF family protein [Moraxella sp. K2450]MDI4482583.1 ComF family protein [Moraxella lacunata]